MSAVEDRSESESDGAVLRVDTRLGRTVAGMLRAKIASRELPPGARLIPADIAADLGVSRGPVREAIAELVQQGLVEQLPRRAAFVRGLTANDVGQLSLLRGVLEGVVVRLANDRLDSEAGVADLAALERIIDQMRAAGAQRDRAAVTRLDNAFHDRLAAMAGFPTLAQILASLGSQIRPLIEAANEESDVSAVWSQHQPYVAAFHARDARRAEQYASEHAHAAGKRIIARLTKAEATARKPRKT